jgi:Carboxypeptidase regulatory-like domain
MPKFNIALLVCLPTVFAQINPNGIIQGTVADDKGQSMSGAIVSALLNARPPFSRTATSAADGSFQILGLPPGNYTLCAQVSRGGYVNSCQWSVATQSVTLANKQVSANNLITLRKAAIIKIRMQDPNQLLGQKTPDGRQPHLLIAVATPRGLSTARKTGKDNNGSDYELTVPFDTNLIMQVTSRDLKLGDDHGNPLVNNRARDHFQQPSNSPNSKNFTYTVVNQFQ